MRERTAYRFWYALRVFIIAYPAKFVNPKILKNFKKDCQLDNSVKIRYNNSVRRTSRRFAPARLRNSRLLGGWAAISYYLCHWRLSRRTLPPEQATLTERVIRSRLRTPLTTPSFSLAGLLEREEIASLSWSKD